MILSVFSPVFAGMSLEESLKFLKDNGVRAMELGCGGYPGTAHADAKELVKDKIKLAKLKDTFAKHDIAISALSVHGNCVHPDKAVAAGFEVDFTAALELAEKLSVKTVVTFSGCPGSDKGAQNPSWVTCAWPNEYQNVLKYQWEDVLFPYWEKAAARAAERGVEKIALEMHPGFCVYNPATLLKLRSVSDMIGANFDPSHLFWQGIDIPQAIEALRGAIHFFHAKDTQIFPRNTAVNGVLDTGSYADVAARSWVFRTVGYGNGELCWKQILSSLALAGYHGAISIEHEDSLMTPMEGLKKAIDFLKTIIIEENNQGEAWWI